MSKSPIFHRLQLVTGKEGVEKLSNTKVIIFGVGGVGSWCAEGLIRSGIGKLTIVDSDQVCVTNINRQLQATIKTVGQEKVDALKTRLTEINPRADVEAVVKIYDKDTAHEFNLSDYDYVIDAIDSVTPKIHLIKEALKSSATLFSSMGAACKLDPTRLQIADIKKTYGCPLAKIVRTRLKKEKVKAKFNCVFSPEVLPVQEGSIGCGTGKCVCPPKKDENGNIIDNHEWCSTKAVINGSVVHITAIVGFYLNSMVVNDVMAEFEHIKPFS